jgi:Sec-independent protein secretion pathway component TatC
MSLLDHLDEFRRRLVYSCLAVAVGIVVAFAFITQIVAFVFAPIRGVRPAGSKLI